MDKYTYSITDTLKRHNKVMSKDEIIKVNLKYPNMTEKEFDAGVKEALKLKFVAEHKNRYVVTEKGNKFIRDSDADTYPDRQTAQKQI